MFETVKLKSISKYIGSGITPSRSNVDYWLGGTIPWLKTEQLGSYEIYETTEKITKVALEETSIKVFPINTISIAMYGEGRTRGNVSILKAPMTTNQACCNIVLDETKADYRYVYYFLKTQYQNLRSLSSGVRKNLNSNDIKEFSIRIPSLDIQRKVSDFLSGIDSKISLNKRINAELEAMAKTIYDYWFLQFDFPISKEQAKAIGKPKLEGKPYKASGGKMVWSEELKREVPEGWEVGVINDLGEIVGGSTPSTNDYENFQRGGTAWITPKDLSLNVGKKFITRGEVSVSEKGIQNASLKIMPKGTILLSSRAPIGYMAVAREAVTSNQGFKNIIPNKGYSSEVVYYTVKNLLPVIERNASGSTFKEISGSVLKSIKVLLPPRQLATSLTEQLSSIFRKQDVLELENEKLAELRDWLLPMLMNGQVRIKEAVESKVIDATKKRGDFKPESVYNYQAQVFALIAEVSKQNKIKHGEMTIAKYAYLIDKIKGIPTFFEYGRHHLGPWAKEMKPVLLNKKNFKIDDEGVSVVNRDLLKGNPYENQIKDAILELTTIITGYKSNERSHQTELLATVCKVIEDIKSTDLKQVRESMKNWPIDLKTTKFKNKAEKFSEPDTRQALLKILELGWDKRLR